MKRSKKMSILGAGLALAVAELATAQVGANAGLLNPNLASAEQLSAVPHIDPELTQKILDARPFLGPEELQEVMSAALNQDELDSVYRQLFLPIHLNEASLESILSIPGVGERMAHEFEEYRPYKALAQFRREIGKYVDDEEVARLEQYVFVPINLNTASPEDFRTIPGVGDRLVGEFMEYRPYVDIKQFRREIGKYVDDDEVARFERYVTLN